ncbi:MAG: ABC transporter ATP-binding protein [Candidatus Saccharimonadales bacterium]|jgi:ATP-binding cassette subfamily B protein
MFRILKYLKPFIAAVVAIFVLMAIQVYCNLQLPDLMAKIVDQGIVPDNRHMIWTTGLTMIIITLIGGVSAIIVGYFAARTATGFAKNIRNLVFKKVESFSKAELDHFSTASLITRSTNDIQQIQLVMVLLFTLVLMAPMMGFGAIIKAIHLAPSMSWIIAVAVTAVIVTVGTFFVFTLPRYRRLQKLVDKLNLVTRENLTGLRVIRAFNREDYEENKFEQTNQELTRINLFINRLQSALMPVMLLIFNFTSILIIWIGAHYVNTNHLQIGSVIAFMQYAIQVILSFLMITFIFILLPRAAVSAGRVIEVLDTDPVIKDPTEPKQLADNNRVSVEFRDVSFSYAGADEDVLSNISFTAQPGEVTAIVGSTGSGKSTLINLIPRFYDATKGQILVNGIDVRDLSLTDLHELIGYISQRSVIFSGTIASNISYGTEQASDDVIREAARVAQAENFIHKLEHSYESPIAQEGANVSGGQKQRLSIARALVKQPPIYLFDDSFSALDFTTDAALRRALAPKTKNATVIIVAQRISTVINAQKIVVLDQGRIVGVGDHRELMRSCEVYQEIASSQLSPDELRHALTSPQHLKPKEGIA